nr:hypothetical protein [Tanacetum cinerariifolium]
MSAKRTSSNEFSSAMASAVICLSTGDLSTHTTTYTSSALTQKVFANIRKVGKGFSSVETPLFEGMLVAGVIEEEGDADEQVQDVTADTAAQGADTAVIGDPQPQSKLQAQQLAADFPMSLLQEALDACAALTRRVEHLEYRIDSSDDIVMEDASNQGMIIDALDSDASVALMDDKEAKEAKVASDDQVKGRQAEIYQIDMDHASKVLSIQDDEPEVQEVVDVVTTAKLITEVVSAASESVTAASTTIVIAEPQVPAAIITAALVRVVAAFTGRRKGVVIKDPEEESTTIIPADTKSKDKGKGIMVEEPKPLKKKQQVEMDEEYARKLHEELNKDIDWNVAIDHVKQKAKEDPFVQRYHVIKKRTQTKA